MLESKHFTQVGDPMLACPCCDQGGPSMPLLIVLESIRVHFNKPVTITSCARCTRHNSKVGGAPDSQHRVTSYTVSEAADITIKGVEASEILQYLENTGYSNLLGLGMYDGGRVHVDVRGYAARWDERTS